jgi:hypothetical protein
MPDDLARALAEQPQATECFERFPRSAKRGILEWIVNTGTPVTRSRRIAGRPSWRTGTNGPISGGRSPRATPVQAIG